MEKTRVLKSGKRNYSVHANDGKWGALFLTPLVVGMTLFLLVPLAYAVFLSLNEYNLFVSKWVGFANFERAFRDAQYWSSMANAALYCVFVPITMFIALVLANLLAREFRGAKIYKMVFFIPTICSAVAVTFMWKWMFNGEYGTLNAIRTALGLSKINYLDAGHAMWSMILLSVWSGLGTSLLLYTAAVKNVNVSLLEAAQIDGAGQVRIFVKITFPLITPTTFYLFVTGIIGALQGFATFFAMTGGVSPSSVVMPVTIIYMYAGHGWGINTYGYASALAILLGLVVGALTVLNFVGSKRWVYYE